MAPVRERPGPTAVTCHVCGRPHVRLCTDGAYQAHTQWERYDRLCPALWPSDEPALCGSCGHRHMPDDFCIICPCPDQDEPTDD